MVKKKREPTVFQSDPLAYLDALSGGSEDSQKPAKKSEQQQRVIQDKKDRIEALKRDREAIGASATISDTLAPSRDPASDPIRTSGHVLSRLQARWHALLRDHTPVRVARWDKYETGYVNDLLQQYGNDEDVIATAMAYLVEMWVPVCKRFTKAVGVIPTVSLLHRFHAEIVNEALVYCEWKAAKQAYDDAVAKALASQDRQDPRSSGIVLPIPLDQDPLLRDAIPADVRKRYETAARIKKAATGASWAR